MDEFAPLYGAHPCLDFANTVDGRAQADHIEHLYEYGDLVRWSTYARLIEPGMGRDLDALARAQPDAAAVSFAGGIELREAIHRVFAGLSRGHTPATGDLARIRQCYTAAIAASALEPDGDRFGWVLPGGHLDRVWWPAATAAIELLTAGPVNRVKVCASTRGCDGLFLDTSKNNSRRWCRMEDCGTEAKIHRQTDRRRATRGSSR